MNFLETNVGDTAPDIETRAPNFQQWGVDDDHSELDGDLQEIERDHKPYDRATVSSWAKTVANAQSDKRLDIFLDVVVPDGARASLIHAARGEHSRKQAIIDAQEEIAANHDKFGLSDDVLQKRKGAVWKAIEARGLEQTNSKSSRKTSGKANSRIPLNHFEAPPEAGPEDYGNERTVELPADLRELLPPLQWLDMSNWDHEPVPARQWAIRDRVPLNQAGLFSGEGGTGKSIIELQKNVAHVAGKDWLGSLPERGPAFYIGAEDDKDEIHIRLAAIAKHYGVTFAQLVADGLHVLPLLGKDATLCTIGRSGRVEITNLYRQIYQAAGDIKPKNISVDTLSRAFAGSEIDRVQVYAFAQHMQALAMVAQGSVTILSHPSLAGITSGSGISGSTGWHGAFRFRQYLKGVKADGEQIDNDLREFEFKKNQYGPLGETIVLRYQHGLFLPECGSSSLNKLRSDMEADHAFLACLDSFAEQGRRVSPNKSSTYAPSQFAKSTTGKAIGKHRLEEAMLRLFETKKLIAAPNPDVKASKAGIVILRYQSGGPNGGPN